MIGLVETAWLFTRGPQSVRIIRVTRPSGVVRLLIQGPGPISSTHEIDDTIEAVRYPSQLERSLVAEGYQLALFRSAERRSGLDRRATPRGNDRRRTLQLV
jgi:hypothetical protein